MVSNAAFDGMFPAAGRNAIYNYEGLVAASQLYPSFVGTIDANTCKKEAAAFLANVAHETDRLRHAEEVNKIAYCDPRSYCPCDPNDRTRWFYGRGAAAAELELQLLRRRRRHRRPAGHAARAGQHQRRDRLEDRACGSG